MNNKEITALALKVFAIYLIAEIIIVIPSLYGIMLSVQTWTANPEQQVILIPIILIIAIVIVILLLARLIWNLANEVSYKATDPLNIDHTKLPSDFHEFMLFLLGIFILTDALLRLPSPLASAFYEINHPAKTEGLTIQTGLWIISEVLLVIIGLTLILKRKGWANLYYKLRTAGIKQ